MEGSPKPAVSARGRAHRAGGAARVWSVTATIDPTDARVALGPVVVRAASASLAERNANRFFDALLKGLRGPKASLWRLGRWRCAVLNAHSGVITAFACLLVGDSAQRWPAAVVKIRIAELEGADAGHATTDNAWEDQ